MSPSGVRIQRSAPGGIVNGFYVNSHIGHWDPCCGVFGPLCQFESGAGKDVAKTSIFPLARVVKAVKIKVPNVQAGRFVRFNHRVSRAFDAALYTQCAQQVARQRRFSRP